MINTLSQYGHPWFPYSYLPLGLGGGKSFFGSMRVQPGWGLAITSSFSWGTP